MVSNTSRNGGAVMIGLNRRRTMTSTEDSIPYERIEYLQSDGVNSQYIVLPINVQEGLDVYCKFSIVEASNYGYVFGNQASPSNYFIVRQNGTSGKLQVTFISGSGVTESIAHIGQIRNIHLHLWNGSQICNLDDTVLINQTNAYNNPSYNYKINLWYPASGSFFKGKVRIYEFNAYLHEQLVLDLVPVKDNGVGYMYDKVSGQLFGNDGSGDFILGNDVSSATVVTQAKQREILNNQFEEL